jgi:CBS domain containing-hemolysin-like protein
MGSSGSDTFWIVLAAFCGLLYLIFDALRSFALQVSAVALRRLSGEAEERAGWQLYDARNFQLVTGALLQISLVLAFGATVLAFEVERSVIDAFFIAALVWIAIIMIWKFVLAFIPEDVSELLLRRMIPLTHFFYYVFWPMLFPLRQLFERIERQREVADEDEEEEVTDEEVQAYIDVGEEEGILEASEGKLLQSIVDFSDRMAKELMTPRIDVQAFDAKKPLQELARMFSESKYSRIPIYTESIDQISGIVHIKEIFDAVLKGEHRSVAELARPPYFVSETKMVSELLREFQSEHLQVAVVVDEYGGTAGLITIEDIVEEIVGEISDEHEDDEATIVDLGDGRFLVSGLLRVDELEEMLDAELTGEDYETVAGMIFTTLGRIPKVGAVVAKNGWLFEVDRADRRRIYRVRVVKDPNWKLEEEESE